MFPTSTAGACVVVTRTTNATSNRALAEQVLTACVVGAAAVFLVARITLGRAPA